MPSITSSLRSSKSRPRRQRWDHVQLQNDFREHFARRGFLFNMRDAEDLRGLHEGRLVADYESSRIVAARARERVNAAHRLSQKIIEVIRDA
jgi:hypothetical protein